MTLTFDLDPFLYRQRECVVVCAFEIFYQKMYSSILFYVIAGFDAAFMCLSATLDSNKSILFNTLTIFAGYVDHFGCFQDEVLFRFRHGIGHVHHVDEHVGLLYFLQHRFEGLHEL